MSIYLIKGKGWRYDFLLKGERHTQAWFKTKTMAKQAEAERRKEVQQPQKETQIPTDMDFLELVNRRLDYINAYNSAQHYAEHRSRAKRWVRMWKGKKTNEITREEVEFFLLQRKKVSAHTANKELRRLRAMFNFGKKRGWFTVNPTDGSAFFPEEKKLKYIPTPEEVEKVIAMADLDTQDYLWTIRDTIGRMSEINRLTWDDVSLLEKYVILYTRKKKGGHLTPRKVPMTEKLLEILSRRYSERDPKQTLGVLAHLLEQ